MWCGVPQGCILEPFFIFYRVWFIKVPNLFWSCITVMGLLSAESIVQHMIVSSKLGTFRDVTTITATTVFSDFKYIICLNKSTFHNPSALLHALTCWLGAGPCDPSSLTKTLISQSVLYKSASAFTLINTGFMHEVPKDSERGFRKLTLISASTSLLFLAPCTFYHSFSNGLFEALFYQLRASLIVALRPASTAHFKEICCLIKGTCRNLIVI